MACGCVPTRLNLPGYIPASGAAASRLLTSSTSDRIIGDEAFEIVSFSRIIAAEYRKRSFFCELLSVGPSILEHNVDVERIINIKRSMIGLIQPHAATFCKALEWITEDKAVWASQAIALYVAGLWPIANPSKTIQELSKRPEFECIKFNFETELTAFANTLLLGCKNTNN